MNKYIDTAYQYVRSTHQEIRIVFKNHFCSYWLFIISFQKLSKRLTAQALYSASVNGLLYLDAVHETAPVIFFLLHNCHFCHNCLFRSVIYLLNRKDYPTNGRNWQRLLILTTCACTKFPPTNTSENVLCELLVIHQNI